MDFKLKAPLIIIPQSSTSHNALVIDLGLIRVGNCFSLLPVHGCPLPAVLDNMDIQLTQLKLSRSVVQRCTPETAENMLKPKSDSSVAESLGCYKEAMCNITKEILHL